MHAETLPPIRLDELHFTGPAGERAIRVYRPDVGTSGLPLTLYFHGGGFVGGGLDDADNAARHIAAHGRIMVLAAEYALAPAHPFPAAPEDAYAAACWAMRNASRLGANRDRIAVCGHDAGGNLAATLPLMAKDRNGPLFAAQVLIGPMLDPSMTRLGDDLRLRADNSAASCAACYRQYLPEARQRLHPYASPLISTRQAGLPPALIVTAECDVLHREAETYAEALIGAGVPTQVVRYPKITHSMLARHPQVLEEVTHFLRRRLHEMPSASHHLNL